MKLQDRLILTPGPTEISERVRIALSLPLLTNPDLDEDFFDFYDETCKMLGKIMHTENTVLILAGEGILGLEAAVASLIEPGDKVLCIDNGVFGGGFADFVADYGGEVIRLQKPYHTPVDDEDVRRILEKHDGIKVATLVHHETPAGLLNPVASICPVLKEYGVISIVDAVASIGGEEFFTDKWQADVVLCASQKCFSAPPGLSFLSVSEAAWEKILHRREPIRGLYLNLKKWKEEWIDGRVFPYTQPVNDIYALRESAEMILTEGLPSCIERHRAIAEAVRQTLLQANFSIYPDEGAQANTATVFEIPEGLEDEVFRKALWKNYGVMIAGSWGELSGKVWRIGHMGENAREEKLFRFFRAFDECCADFGFSYQDSLARIFAGKIKG